MIRAISTKKPADILVRAGAEALVFLRVPKVASTAMSYYFNARGGKAIGRQDALKHPDRIAFLRHPVESSQRLRFTQENLVLIVICGEWVQPRFSKRTLPGSVVPLRKLWVGQTL